MSQKKQKSAFIGLSFCLLVCIFASGCSSMRYLVNLPALEKAPEQNSGKALIIFIRPSGNAESVASPIFDITNGLKVLGLPNGEMKMAFLVPAGKSRFMTQCENVDFIDADLVAGKTYYVMISPRIGAFAPHFRLIAFKKRPSDPDYAVDGPRLKKWLDACKPVGNSDQTDKYLTKRYMESITERMNESLLKWDTADEKIKIQHRLDPEDGV